MNHNCYYPNRTPRLQVTPGDTNWHLVGKSGTLYATYAALVAANDYPWPGKPFDFPTGIPFLDVRSIATGGATDGSPIDIITNDTATPGTPEEFISGNGQHMIYDNDGVKCLWVKTSVPGDIVQIFGMF